MVEYVTKYNFERYMAPSFPTSLMKLFLGTGHFHVCFCTFNKAKFTLLNKVKEYFHDKRHCSYILGRDSRGLKLLPKISVFFMRSTPPSAKTNFVYVTDVGPRQPSHFVTGPSRIKVVHYLTVI